MVKIVYIINTVTNAMVERATRTCGRVRASVLCLMMLLALSLWTIIPTILWASKLYSSQLWFMQKPIINTVNMIVFVLIVANIIFALGTVTLLEPIRLAAVTTTTITFIFYVWLSLQTYWLFLVTLPYIVFSYMVIKYLMRYEVLQHFFTLKFASRLKPKQMKAIAIFERFSLHFILFIAVLIATFPVIWIVSTSLRPGELLIDTEMKILPDQITFDHYSEVIYKENFWKYLRNSLICAGGTTLLAIFLASTCAYALSKFDFRGKKGVLMSFIVVQMFPGVIIIVPYFILLKYLGLLNNYLGLIAAYSVTALPLCVWMIKGFFDTVPDDLIEAARVDGYSHFQIFWRIILPLAKPAIAVTALFSFIAAWNEYVLAYTFMLDQEYYTLPVKIYMYIGSAERWGAFSAMSVLVSIPVVVMFIAFQKYLISGMTKGAVKG